MRHWDPDLRGQRELVLPAEAIHARARDRAGYNLAVGGSWIVNPAGRFVREPVFGEDTIVWAEVDGEERQLAKAYNARFDLLRLSIRGAAWPPTGPELL